jgi:phosphatidylinositol alpha 1,6-mannosyltransferase
MRLLAGDSRDYRLVVAGDGPRAAWLQQQAIGALDRRIVLCGNLDRETLAACYASCDVFVHANPREPFGIGPLEAMASGIPVVVPASGGVLEYAHAGNAWVAPPTAPHFAAAIREAADGDLARRHAAFATAHSFGWPRVTKLYFDLYDELHDRRLRSKGGNRAIHAVSGVDTDRRRPALGGATGHD